MNDLHLEREVRSMLEASNGTMSADMMAEYIRRDNRPGITLARVAEMRRRVVADLEESRLLTALLARTCFYCGDPALPETHGFDPRCEKHRDV